MNVNFRNFLLVGAMAILFIVLVRAILAKWDIPFISQIVDRV